AHGKAEALEVLRGRVEATAVLYMGGGDGEEPVFLHLSGADAGVRVGDAGEPSVAAHRVADTPAAAQLLAVLAAERRSWVFGERPTPIERMSLLSNRAAVALVGPDARLLWLCHPEPDSPALFAELLGGRSAGVFSIAPEHRGLPLGQRYERDTMTVRTRFSRLEVIDYLAEPAVAGRTDLVRVVTGTGAAVVEFAPRPDFGRAPVRILAKDDGLVVEGGPYPVALYAPGVSWQVDQDAGTALARVHPTSERPVVLELRCGTDSLEAPGVGEQERRRGTEREWSSWVRTLDLPETERRLVARSALTLRGLCTPTGGVMAAATTSLPEEIGGIRNWDYRYCWLRDGALTVQALVEAGSTAEAEAFLGWVHRVVGGLAGPELLRPLYSLRGTDLGPEEVVESLSGYAGSRPVRVGNLADRQVQLDVFGPVVELVAHLSRVRGELADRDWGLVQEMAQAVARRWHEPDHGIWEERDEPRHRVYSKVMGWVTLDRALGLASAYGRVPDPGWAPLREEIAAEVVERGWSEQAQAFTTAYDGTDLDAASLHIGLSGLIDPSDERFQATVTAVEAELRSGPTVYRYHRDDGLPGGEGGFHLCTTWLIEAYLATGRRAEAEELFAHLVD
ncbi:glycoside hydrolase family 15 protein, partial [Nocardiopsis flavescens]